MTFEELGAAIALAHFMRDTWSNPEKAQAAIIRAQSILNDFMYGKSIEEEAKDEKTYNDAIAEINKVVCTTEYQSVVKKTIPKGKVGRLSKIEMACGDYTKVQWALYINSKLVELESVAGGIWQDVILPTATSFTWHPPGLEIRGGEYVEIQALDDGSSTSAWGALEGIIR